MSVITKEFRSQQRKRVDGANNSVDESNSALFLRKTYTMLTACPSDIACWSDDGSSIIVKDSNRLATEVIPTIFKHNKFSSFVRQLHFYGFRKLRHETNEQYWIFKHPLFKKGDTKSIALIKKSAHVDESYNKSDMVDVKNQLWNLNTRMTELDNIVNMLTMKLSQVSNTNSYNVMPNNIDESSEVSANLKKRKIKTEIPMSVATFPISNANTTTSNVSVGFDSSSLSPDISRQNSLSLPFIEDEELEISNNQNGSFDFDKFYFDENTFTGVYNTKMNELNSYDQSNNFVDNETAINGVINFSETDMHNSLWNDMELLEPTDSTYSLSAGQPGIEYLQHFPNQTENLANENFHQEEQVTSNILFKLNDKIDYEKDVASILTMLPKHLQDRFIDQLAFNVSQKMNVVDNSTATANTTVNDVHVMQSAPLVTKNTLTQNNTTNISSEHHTHKDSSNHTAVPTGTVFQENKMASIQIIPHEDHNDFTFTCHIPNSTTSATTATHQHIISSTNNAIEVERNVMKTPKNLANKNTVNVAINNDGNAKYDKSGTALVSKTNSVDDSNHDKNESNITKNNININPLLKTNDMISPHTSSTGTVITATNAVGSNTVTVTDENITAMAALILKCMSSLSLALASSDRTITSSNTAAVTDTNQNKVANTRMETTVH